MDSAHGSQEFIGTGNELFIVSRSTLAVATLLIVCPAGTCPFRMYPNRAYPCQDFACQDQVAGPLAKTEGIQFESCRGNLTGPIPNHLVSP
jgi:hypothetical protein